MKLPIFVKGKRIFIFHVSFASRLLFQVSFPSISLNTCKMFLCLFIDFSLAEQMRLFKMLSGKKPFIEFHGEISPFLFLRYAFVADLATVLTRN